MAARSFKTVSRWFPRSFDPRKDEDNNERNGLLRSHLEQIVSFEDAEAKALAPYVEPKEAKAVALHVEPMTVELKVSIHCHGCARKVEKQVSKLQGVVSYKVELGSKKVTVVGNVSPTEVLDSIRKVMKHAEILAPP